MVRAVRVEIIDVDVLEVLRIDLYQFKSDTGLLRLESQLRIILLCASQFAF